MKPLSIQTAMGKSLNFIFKKVLIDMICFFSLSGTKPKQPLCWIAMVFISLYNS